MPGKRINAEGARIELEGHRLFVDGGEVEPSTRRLKELRDVAMDKAFITKENEEDPLYYMYRGIGNSLHEEFRKSSIRYDITIMESYMIGPELNKTYGHYHTVAENGLEYPEIYEVISGSALYLLQKKVHQSYDIRLISAKTGDKVIMPPNYGHITINTGKSLLVMANLLYADFDSDYESIKRMNGGAVYVLAGKKLEPNPAYGRLSMPSIEKAQEDDDDRSLYDQLVSGPERFLYLKKPSLCKQ